jgi:hypothetical protein
MNWLAGQDFSLPMADTIFSFAGISRQMKKIFLCALCDSVVNISIFVFS